MWDLSLGSFSITYFEFFYGLQLTDYFGGLGEASLDFTFSSPVPGEVKSFSGFFATSGTSEVNFEVNFEVISVLMS